MQSKALQRSKYMCLDNDVDDQNKFTENMSSLSETGPSATPSNKMVDKSKIVNTVYIRYLVPSAVEATR